MAFVYSHLVITVFLTEGLHRRVGKPGVGIDLEQRKRIGNGGGGDVGRFAAGCLWGQRLKWPALFGPLTYITPVLAATRAHAGLCAPIAIRAWSRPMVVLCTRLALYLRA